VEEEHQGEGEDSRLEAEVADFLEVEVGGSAHQEGEVPLEAEDVDFKYVI
jgi:hypothetical protein